MRTHGYPSFPDPDSQGAFDFNGSSSIDPNSSQFQAAMSACRPGNSKVRFGSESGCAHPDGEPRDNEIETDESLNCRELLIDLLSDSPGRRSADRGLC